MRAFLCRFVKFFRLGKRRGSLFADRVRDNSAVFAAPKGGSGNNAIAAQSSSEERNSVLTETEELYKAA